MIPQIDKTYKCFDDGKVNRGRMYEVTIRELVPFKEMTDELILDIWKDCSTDSSLFSEETDYFCLCYDDPDEELEVFVRTKNGGWFGISNKFLVGGRLDIDGSLYNRILETEKEYGV